MKQLKRIVVALVVAALAVMNLMPTAYLAVEEAPEKGILRYIDIERLTAFWQLEAYDGLNNGEACYDFEIHEGYHYLDETQYSGGARTILVNTSIAGAYGFEFDFAAMLDYWIEGEIGDCYMIVYPDLYGELNLCDTNVVNVGNSFRPAAYPDFDTDCINTHITKLLLDNCGMLISVRCNGQQFCTEFSALNCPELLRIMLLDCGLRSIAFDLHESDSAVNARAFGRGTIGADYGIDIYDGIIDPTLFAYDGDSPLTGWYSGGAFVGSETEIIVPDGGAFYAVFGGDADGDGSITVADALLAMRGAMGLIEADEVALDMNASGGLDIADALLLLRLSMGVA